MTIKLIKPINQDLAIDRVDNLIFALQLLKRDLKHGKKESMYEGVKYFLTCLKGCLLALGGAK